MIPWCVFLCEGRDSKRKKMSLSDCHSFWDESPLLLQQQCESAIDVRVSSALMCQALEILLTSAMCVCVCMFACTSAAGGVYSGKSALQFDAFVFWSLVVLHGQLKENKLLWHIVSVYIFLTLNNSNW